MTKSPGLQHWLRAGPAAAKVALAWVDDLIESAREVLQAAFAYLDEEARNYRLVSNGFPEKQTFFYVPRPHHEAPAGLDSAQCCMCGTGYLAHASTVDEHCPYCVQAGRIRPALVPVVPLLPGAQLDLFGEGPPDG